MIFEKFDDIILKEGYDNLKELYDIPDDIKVIAEKGEKLTVKWDDNNVYITYPFRAAFFRGLSLASLALSKGDKSDIKETPYFDNCGIMLDLSRNRVLTVEGMKKYASYMAKMGLNILYLYMEDIYEITEYPYFGYMRGRYSKSELKEIDDYCYSIGIEVVPAIQTLAHMEQALKWDELIPLRDTVDVLLADDEKTYDFIRTAIKSVSSCFRTKKIQLGMDEAAHLGTGKYYKLHGPQVRTEILIKHVHRVSEIARELGLEFSMFGSILFLISNIPVRDQSIDKIEIPQMFVDNFPKDMHFAYANYYNDSRAHYKKIHDSFLKFTDRYSFWGGIWTWRGHTCDMVNTIKMSEPALLACKDSGVKNVVGCIWGDDGAECDFFFTLAGMMYFAEHAFNSEVDNQLYKDRFESITETSLEAFFDMSYFHNDFEYFNDYESYHPRYIGKRYFWADLLIGLLDEDLRIKPMSDYYKGKMEKYKAYLNDEDKWYGKHLLVFRCLEAVYKKCFVIENLKKAYDEKDMPKLKEFAEIIIPELIKAFDDCANQHRIEWYRECKPNGFEVLDIRYGGLIRRYETAIKRLKQFLNGEIDKIDELECPRLLHRCEGNQSRFHGISTACLTK